MAKVNSHEVRRILQKGEVLREDPKTILLSLPVFAYGFLYYFLTGDRGGVGGSLGHSGIAFKNYHRHFWQNGALLKIAFWLFDAATKYSSGEGKASTILHAGQVALELGEFETAEERFEKALEAADEINHEAMRGYIYGHMAVMEMRKKDMKLAKKYADQSHKILKRAIQTEPESMYLQIWMSQSELLYGKYYLTTGDSRTAREWAEKALKRSEKYKLKVRQLDAKKLLEAIG